MQADLRALRERLAEIYDLRRSGLMLGWDLRVTMPPLGASPRADAIATLGRIAHDRFVDDEIGRLLDRLHAYGESLGYDSDDASLIRVVRRDWEKERRVPGELRAEISRAAAHGHHVWAEARARSDFSLFLPVLERNVELKRRYAECFDWDDSPYTPLLDDYERSLTTTEVAAVFDAMRPALAELVREAPRIDAPFFGLSYPPDLQRQFVERVVSTLGFEEGSWRLDTTEHAFCTSFSRLDVRLTTRFRAKGLRAIWTTLHEAGHGLHAHGSAPSLERTLLAGSPSFGISESQSRTWENLVGRSRPFWAYWYEPVQQTFPEQLGDVELDTFMAAVNRVNPSVLRGEADEASYNLHIILRFELERRLIEGTLEPRHAPEAWNARVQELLGLEVPDDAHGVLQDVHWSSASLGYFPTYALGNVYSLQFWSAVREAIPDVDAQLEAGEVLGVGEWLRDNLYALGRKLTPRELLERLTGTPEIDPEPLLAYLREKAAAPAT